MKRLRIYLDTSVINFLFADDAPDFRRVTVEFFERYAAQYELFGSDVLIREHTADSDPQRRDRHFLMLKQWHVAMLPGDLDDEVARLADAYLCDGVVPLRKRDDALHVAYATVFEMDVVLSWNFKHLANLRREARFMVINQAQGYLGSPRIVSPMELQDENEE